MCHRVITTITRYGMGPKHEKKWCRDTQKVVFHDFRLAIYDYWGKKWAPDFDDVLRSICGIVAETPGG